ncbi:MAG: hypothetical protein KDC98_06305 [Planctomycetes bacterium]|nr:hypothetical protein [Planctomycetota bacterium]
MKLLAAIVACLVGHAGLVAQDTDPGQADDTFVTKELCGFEVRLVNGFGGHALHDEVMRLLEDQLYRITRVAPEPALGKLRKVPIWIGHEDPRHAAKCMFYHPNPRWLADNDYPTRLAGGVEVANARNFLRWTLDQPWMVLHELAHAYHHQVLGYGNADIRAAFGAAKKEGLYQKVLRIGGTEEKHYALTNEQEYFAEATEAYFGTNDFYPFVRSELRRYDPRCHAMLEKVWGKRRQ